MCFLEENLNLGFERRDPRAPSEQCCRLGNSLFQEKL